MRARLSLIHSAMWLVLAALGAVLSSGTAKAGDTWYPFPVDVWQTPFDASSERDQMDYVPLEEASEKWRICVSFPHMKDAYWLAVNFGIVEEVKRLGVAMKLYEAGGYGNLNVQRNQIQECMDWGAQAVLLGAISEDGLNDLITELADEGVPVIDLINGVSSPDIAGKAQVTFYDMGFLAGQYLVDLTLANNKPAWIAWFPGPEGAGWVKAGDQGLRDALKGSLVEIIATSHGDTGKGAQLELLNSVLKQHAHIDFIVGTAVTAEAATSELRKRRLTKQVGVMSYYYSPGVHKGIRRGTILAAPTDLPGVQGRIGVDMAVRALEKKLVLKHVAPQPTVVDFQRLETFDESTSLPPRGFRATFDVN